MSDKEKPLLIGFYSSTGPQSGKSYMAKLLEDAVMEQLLRIAHLESFAGPVKAVSHILMDRLLGLNIRAMDKASQAYGGKTVRDVYVSVGDGMREYDENFWVARMLERLLSRNYSGPRNVVIIDDVRYMNEYELITREGGVVFNVFDMKGNRPMDAGDRELMLPEYWRNETEIKNYRDEESDRVALHAMLMTIERYLDKNEPTLWRTFSPRPSG